MTKRIKYVSDYDNTMPSFNYLDNITAQNNIKEKNCFNKKDRNMNAFEYIPNGRQVDAGFGDINIKNQMQFGSNTRLGQKDIRNMEYDRFYETNFNYHSINISSLSLPADTRYLNKKF